VPIGILLGILCLYGLLNLISNINIYSYDGPVQVNVIAKLIPVSKVAQIIDISPGKVLVEYSSDKHEDLKTSNNSIQNIYLTIISSSSIFSHSHLLGATLCFYYYDANNEKQELVISIGDEEEITARKIIDSESIRSLEMYKKLLNQKIEYSVISASAK
jgi:hypothetical protein